MSGMTRFKLWQWPSFGAAFFMEFFNKEKVR